VRPPLPRRRHSRRHDAAKAAEFAPASDGTLSAFVRGGGDDDARRANPTVADHLRAGGDVPRHRVRGRVRL